MSLRFERWFRHMDSSQPASLVLMGIVFVIGTGIALAFADALRWRKRIASLALSLGFEPVTDQLEKSRLSEKLRIVNQRHQGKRVMLHLFKRSAGSYDVFLCDYRFASASGKARGGERFILALVSNGWNIPRFSIEAIPESKNALIRALNRFAQNLPIPGLERVESQDPTFNQRFRLFAQSGSGLSALPGGSTGFASLSSQLLAEGSVYLDAGGDTLVLSSLEIDAERIQRKTDPQKFERLMSLADGLFSTLRPSR